jgi:hypothetical protein
VPNSRLRTSCEMVGPDGLEPSTPRLSSACSNQLSYEPKMGKWRLTRRQSRLGGADRVRTGDPLLAKQVLYQLSYDPFKVNNSDNLKNILLKFTLCDQLEPRRQRVLPHRFLRPSALPLAWHRRLLRKEVIQPQVPLRLPCYDFVPITSLTLGRRFHCWLANALRAKPAFMT